MKSKKIINKKVYKKKRTHKKKRKYNRLLSKKKKIIKKVSKKQKGGIKCLTIDVKSELPSKPPPPLKPSDKDIEIRNKINKSSTLMICVNRYNDYYRQYIQSYNAEATKNSWTKIPGNDEKIITIDDIPDGIPYASNKQENVDINGKFPGDLKKYLVGYNEDKKFDIICFWHCGALRADLFSNKPGTLIADLFSNNYGTD